MSENSLPLEQWPAGIQQASVPANENALRVQALLSRALSVENDAPGTEYNGAVYIVGDTPTGAFAALSEHDIALYEYDSWYAWSPVLGSSMVIADERMVFDGTEWIADPSVGGGGGSGIVESIVAGTGISVDDTDPANPVVSATGGGGGSDVVDVSTPSNASGTVTLNFASKSKYVGAITLSANVTTLAFSNLPGSGKYAEYELHITQDGTGSRTFAIPASHKALGGSDTAIAAAANAVTVLTASTVDNGTTWRYAMQESA